MWHKKMRREYRPKETNVHSDSRKEFTPWDYEIIKRRRKAMLVRAKLHLT